MFKLVTGSPGDGKTSNELWDFLNGEQYKNRPKYCTPIKGFKASEHGVTEIEHIKDWQELPEGSAIFCDEVQNYCGTDIGKEAPEWVKQLALHRHHGYDFICTTQSPMFLHPFARKLAKPHVHYIRPWNMKGARYTWDNVQNDPNTKTAKALGQRQLVTPNPKVFTLYTSTVLDTHRPKPPYKIFAVLGVALAVLLGGAFYVYRSVSHIGHESQAPVAEELRKHAVTTAAQERAIQGETSGPEKPVWTEESLKPRLSGQQYSAPVYDALTAPTDFPRVAGCISSESRGTCNCFTQQATPIEVPASACLVFVKYGSFDPWLTGRRQGQQSVASKTPSPASGPESAPVSRNKGVPVNVVADTSTLFMHTKDAIPRQP